MSCEAFYEAFCEMWSLEISAGCYREDFQIHILPRNTARELDGKRTEEGKKKSLGTEQPLRVACSQEGAYEGSEEQRRDGVTRNGIECTSYRERLMSHDI